MTTNDETATTYSDNLYATLEATGIKPLYDDRTDKRGGEKLAVADLVGAPMQIIVGARGLAGGVIEVKDRISGTKETLPAHDHAKLGAALKGLAPKPTI